MASLRAGLEGIQKVPVQRVLGPTREEAGSEETGAESRAGRTTGRRKQS